MVHWFGLKSSSHAKALTLMLKLKRNWTQNCETPWEEHKACVEVFISSHTQTFFIYNSEGSERLSVYESCRVAFPQDWQTEWIQLIDGQGKVTSEKMTDPPADRKHSVYCSTNWLCSARVCVWTHSEKHDLTSVLILLHHLRYIQKNKNTTVKILWVMNVVNIMSGDVMVRCLSP